ncbi:bacterio-opsin activator domain-containing protein [Saliphagus sp. GCM10025334]
MSGDASLEILLIEDNPGDARLIEEMLSGVEELNRRLGSDSSNGESPVVHHETRLEDGLAYLDSPDAGATSSTDGDGSGATLPTGPGSASESESESASVSASATPINVVLLDLNLPDSAGLETLTAVLESDATVPVIVLTGLQDSDAGIEAISRGAQEYLVKDEVTSPMLVRTIAHAIKRHEQLIERERRREELEALNRLNRIGQEITRDAITTSSREALEQAVCDRLAADDAYRFVWIGDVSPGGPQVVPRAAAGVEDGYLDEITITDDDGEHGSGPTALAIETEVIQVVRDIERDSSYEPWRDSARERSFRSSAAIPILHDNVRYGILNVYSSRPHAFTEYEQTLLGRLGDVIGHAIAALERKDALLSDAVLELEFRVEGAIEPLVEATAKESAEVTIEQFIRSGDRILAYGSAEGIDHEELGSAIDRTDDLEEFRVLTPGRNEYDFELTKTGDIELFETVASRGGRVKSARIDDGTFRLVIELSQQSETARVIETVESICPGATYAAQRTADRSSPSIPSPGLLETKLTDRQYEALETAYLSGFFEWPRTSTGEEVAERLDISPATFTQHLRAAEQKFFDSVFSASESDEGGE